MTPYVDDLSRLRKSGEDLPRHMPHPLPPELAPVKPFPMQALPDALRPWIDDVSDRMQAPPDFVAVPMLVGASFLAARKVAIRPQANTDWTERANLWALVVGRPGLMKSPSLASALAPLERLETLAADAHAEAIQYHAAEVLAHKLRADVAEKEARKLLAKDASADIQHLTALQAPDAPVRRRFIINDATYERLGEVLVGNPDGVLSVRDEMRGLLTSLGREENAAARAFYLQAWSGGRYTFDRIGRGTTTVVDTRLSMVGCIQPGPLSSFIHGATRGGARDDGMLQRFLICWPDSPAEWTNVDRFPNAGAKRRVYEAFDRLDSLDLASIGADLDTNFRGESEGLPFLRFAPAAREMFEHWRVALEARMRAAETGAAIEAALSKFRKHIPALALTVHLLDNQPGPVTIEAVARALLLADYFESHLQRAYASGTQPTVTAAKALLRKLRSGALENEFTSRDIYRRAWSGLSDREVVESAIEMLVAYGYLAEQHVQTGGRPTSVYTMLPSGDPVEHRVSATARTDKTDATLTAGSLLSVLSVPEAPLLEKTTRSDGATAATTAPTKRRWAAVRQPLATLATAEADEAVL